MAGINSMEALLALYTVEDRVDWLKTPTVALDNVTGTLLSTWAVPGVPDAAAIPGAAATCSSSTPGALPFRAITAGKKRYITTGQGTGRRPGVNFPNSPDTFLYYDRLVEAGGLSCTVTTAQTVNTPTLPARLNSSTGVDVEAFLENYQTVTTPATVTATIVYTDSTNSSRTTTVSFTPPAGAATTKTFVLPIPAAAGAVGWKSIQTVQLSGAAAATAGNFGVTLAYRILMTPSTVNSHLPNAQYGPMDGCLAPIHDDACVWIVVIEASAQSGGQPPYGGLLGVVVES